MCDSTTTAWKQFRTMSRRTPWPSHWRHTPRGGLTKSPRNIAVAKNPRHHGRLSCDALLRRKRQNIAEAVVVGEAEESGRRADRRFAARHAETSSTAGPMAGIPPLDRRKAESRDFFACKRYLPRGAALKPAQCHFKVADFLVPVQTVFGATHTRRVRPSTIFSKKCGTSGWAGPSCSFSSMTTSPPNLAAGEGIPAGPRPA